MGRCLFHAVFTIHSMKTLIASIALLVASFANAQTISIYYNGGVSNAHMYAWVNYSAATADEAYVDLGEVPIGISYWELNIVTSFQGYRMAQLLILAPGDQFNYWECVTGSSPAITIWWDNMPWWNDCLNFSRYQVRWNADFADCESGLPLFVACDSFPGLIVDPPNVQLGEPTTYLAKGKRLAKGHQK